MKNKFIILSFTVALIIAGIFSIFASSYPDGLEKVAEEQNFANSASSTISGIMPDYLFPLVENQNLAISLAGIFGVLIVFALTFILGKILLKRYI